MINSVRVANEAGSLVVQKPGTAAIGMHELIKAMDEFHLDKSEMDPSVCAFGHSTGSA